MKVSLFTPLYKAVVVLFAVLMVAASSLHAQQTELPVVPKATDTDLQNWNPFNDAMLYFTDFAEVQRVDRWVFTPGTVGTHMSALPAGGTASPLSAEMLPVYSAPSVTYCVPRCTRKGEVFMYFHAGGDRQTYEQARRVSGVLESWGATITVKVRGLSASNVELFSYTEVLVLNQGQPERLVVKNTTQYFQERCTAPSGYLDKLEVTVLSYTAPTVVSVQGVVRLEVGFKEELNIDAKPSGNSTCTQPSIIEYPNHSYSEDGSKYTVESNNYFYPFVNPASTVNFRWNIKSPCTADSFPNWQFQLLKLYNTDKTLDNSDPNVRRLRSTIDWSKALTLETGSKKQELALTIPEGDGMYIWRVRPIGNYYEGGITNPQNWGCWSPSPENGAQILAEYVQAGAQTTPYYNRVDFLKASGTAYGPWSAFYYRQFDNDKNWSYQRSFAETSDDGIRIGEGITYANDIMSPVQTQTKLQSDNTVLGAQAAYDFAGRPVLQTLIAPLPSQTNLKYKPLLLTTSGGTLYRAENFDELSVSGVPQAASGVVSSYYSSANADPSIPSAEGYPFATSRFYKDGRVKEAGGVGLTHQVGQSTPRTGRVYYASVTDAELVSIFGDEAPTTATVSKVITIDPNNVASVQYISSDGMLLAACLVDAGELPATLAAGNTIPTTMAAPLMNLEGETVNVLNIVDNVRNRDGAFIDNHTYRTAKNYTFTKPNTVLTLDYTIIPQNAPHSCLNYCMRCDYSVQVRVINVATGAVVYNQEHIVSPGGNLYSAGGCNAISEQHPIANVTVTLPTAGTYIVERTVRTDNPGGTPSLPASEWHAREAASRIKPLNDILQELHLLPTSTLPASLDVYNQTRIGKNNIYSWNPLVQDGYNVAWCGGLSLPVGECPSGCPVESNSFPSFEQYLFTELNETPGTDGLNRWFRNADGSAKYLSPFPNYTASGYGIAGATTTTFPEGQRMFDELVGNMIADGYNCKQLWKCWQATVAQFKALRGPDGGGVPGVHGVTFDLLQAFLDCAVISGKNKALQEMMKEGINTAYGTPTGFGVYSTKGYLSHAHQYFRYVNAASPCSTFVSGTYGAYPWSNGSPAWQDLYGCLRATGNPPSDIPTCVLPPFPVVSFLDKQLWNDWKSCMEAKTKDVEHACVSRCEELRPDFKKSIELSHPGASPLMVECMLNALMQDCTDGCAVNFAITVKDANAGNSYSPYPGQQSDIIITNTTNYSAIKKRMNGKFTVGAVQNGSCPDNTYENVGSTSTLKKLQLLADYLTKLFNEAAQMKPVPPIKFFEEAMAFLDNTPCLNRSDIKGLLQNVVVRPGAKAVFTTGYDDRGTPSTDDDCCELFYQSTWPESPVVQAQALNTFLDRTWGQPVVGFTPSTSAVVQTAYLNYTTSGTVIAPTSMPHYKHTYYNRPGVDPLVDSLWKYANNVNTADTTGRPNGIANFKILPGKGDDDFSDELAGVIASRTTDVFALYNPSNPNSNVWRGFGTVVIQLPRQSLSDPVQKFVVRLTRATSDDTQLMDIAVDKHIGATDQSRRYTATRSGEEFLSLTEQSFTQSIGKFIVLPDGRFAFELQGSNKDRIPFIDTKFQLTRTTTASARFDVTPDCIICQPTSCNVCIAWQNLQAPVLTEYPASEFIPMDCEQKEIERIKAVIAGEYDAMVKDIKKQVADLYATSCANPAKIADKLTVSYGERLYHYTLFYYDRAGQLVRTVPPKGVVDFASVDRMRHPQQQMETRYDYNLMGQLVRKITPDEGMSQMWYDSKGRVRFSQKAYQVANNNYLYFNYDELGRMVETGEFTYGSDITSLLETPVTTGLRYINRLVFDQPSTFNWGGGYGVLPGRNTYNRLAEVLHQNVGESNTITDNWARTSFSYDEHGNPEWTISSTGKDNITSGITKVVAQTVYEYDIASGTPTKVKYREGFADQFFRRYNYDGDNRLTSVESSRDNVLWETDASYAFYPHGALRRTMLGADSVQGIDYTYTIQGWLKAINHPSLDVQYDPGRDGNSISGTTNKTKFGKDAFGMSLGYFPGDFLHTSSPFHSGTGALSYNLNPGNQLYDGTTNSPLYDGTITTQSSFIRPPVAGVLPDMAARQFKELVGESYRYDRSYRLRSSYFGPYQYAPPDNQSKPKWYMDGDYESHYKYDANGNFTYLRRWGRIAGPPYNVLSVNKKMDEIGDYVYTSGTNRLESFSESSYMTPFYPDDIDGEYMQSGNYVYDASGRLTTDKQEGVKPKWDVYDMVVEVVNNNGPLSGGESTPSASSKKIRYRYNAGGQRVQRLVFNFNASNGDFESEPALVQSYVYGMGGELLGVYEQKYVSGILQAEAVLKEWPLYGAGRLGLAQPAGTAAHSSTLLGSTDTYSRIVDKKRYELSDHLGNVRAVVSDLKLDDGNGSFLPDEKAYYNYYPYGMLHPNRSWEAESYRFGFNGVEKENDVTVAGGIAMADFRMYDARVGRWWGVDKVVKVHESPYAAFFNNPINFADPSGLEGESSPTEPEITSIPRNVTITGSDGRPIVEKGSIIAYAYPPESGSTPTPTSDKSTISSPTFDPSYGPLKAWSDFNNSYSVWRAIPIVPGLNVGDLSRMTYTTLDNAGLFVGNLANKTLMLDIPLRHINGDIANPNEIYYASVDTWINIWTSFIGGSVFNTELQATKVEVQAVKGEVQTVAKAEVKATVRSESKVVKSERAVANEVTACFTEGTVVATPEGKVSIESIQEGDSVYAYNEQTKEVETRRVTATSKRWYEGGIIYIVVGADTIQATREHPFYVEGSWVEAEDLKVGDRLTLLGGRTDNVRATWSRDTALFVYNFTVEEEHTYYVSNSGVLVHNQCDADAANGGHDIAFGLGDDLFNFAETMGFQTYRNFSTGFQQDKILSAINNSSNKLHFNLTGFSKKRFSIFNPANPVSYRNITNWELHTILNNPNALERTTFYRFFDGRYDVEPNPF